MNKKQTNLLVLDRQIVWHPYTSMSAPLSSYLVESANGVELQLHTGEKLIDGMASWWAAIHGYNNEKLNNAIIEQMGKMAHVMFGGLTHEPAINLCQRLVEITPIGLDKVFLSDSGSVSVEVAMKMALQYWHSKENHNNQANTDLDSKNRFLTVHNGYHGDTFAAMSVCDPINGMHQLFEKMLTKQLFAPAPQSRFSQPWLESDIDKLSQLFAEHHQTIAAFIIEPIVQGAGGMRIYHPEYLNACRALCDKFNVLMIVDEIATGFGRTGKLFACEHANISPDILCLGKALTGGYMSLAATLCTSHIATTISNGDAGCFMHGPTFMGNPLACAVATASLALLANNQWQQQVSDIEKQFKSELLPLQNHQRVADVRILGAIGIIEAKQAVNMEKIQQRFVELGVWIRPFGKLIYLMPPFIIKADQLTRLIFAITVILDEDRCFQS